MKIFTRGICRTHFICQTQNWTGHPWCLSCPTPLDLSFQRLGRQIVTILGFSIFSQTKNHPKKTSNHFFDTVSITNLVRSVQGQSSQEEVGVLFSKFLYDFRNILRERHLEIIEVNLPRKPGMEIIDTKYPYHPGFSLITPGCVVNVLLESDQHSFTSPVTTHPCLLLSLSSWVGILLLQSSLYFYPSPTLPCYSPLHPTYSPLPPLLSVLHEFCLSGYSSAWVWPRRRIEALFVVSSARKGWSSSKNRAVLHVSTSAGGKEGRGVDVREPMRRTNRELFSAFPYQLLICLRSLAVQPDTASTNESYL